MFIFLILCIVLPVALIIGNSLIITYSPSTYQKLLINNKDLPLSQKDRYVLAGLLYNGIAYQKSPQTQLETGKLAFSQKEIDHMLDVSKLVKKLSIFFIFIFLLSSSILIWLIRNKFQWLKFLPTISLVLSIGFLVVALLTFSSSFTLFHRLFFQNDFWLLDPSKDLLINLFPESFFILQFTKIVVLSILDLIFIQFLLKLFPK